MKIKYLLLVILLLFMSSQAFGLTPVYTTVQAWAGSQNCTGTNVLCSYNPSGSVSDNYSISFNWNMDNEKQRLIINEGTDIAQPYIMDIGSKTDTLSNLNYVRYWDGSTNEKFNSSAMCGFGDTATYNYRLNFYDNNTFNIFKDGVLCYKRNNLITSPFVQFDQLAGGWSASSTVVMTDITIYNISLGENTNNLTLSAIYEANGSQINNFSVNLRNETTNYYFNTTGTNITSNIFGNSSGYWNVTYFKPNYYNRTYSNIDIITPHVGSIYQSIITPKCYEKISGELITCTNSTFHPLPINQTYNIGANSYFDISQQINISVLQNKTVNITGFYNSNYSINSTFANGGGSSNCSYNITSLNYTYNEYLTTTTNGVIAELINGTYNIIAECQDYAFANQNITANNPQQHYNFTLYTTNAIGISIMDEETGNLILNNVTVTIIKSDLTQTQNITSTGLINLNYLDPDNYSIEFERTGYATRQYPVEVGNKSYQTLKAYLLANSTNNVVFTIKNEDTGTVIEGATTTIKRTINNTPQIIDVLESDISGKIQFTFDVGVRYNFITTENGYVIKEFSLDPIIFDSYTINLKPDTLEQESGDFSGITIQKSPSLFYNEQLNALTFTFASPSGNFENYGFNATYKNQYVGSTGTNSYGAVTTAILNVTNASLNDRVIVNYHYKTTTSTTNYYSDIYEVTGATIGDYSLLGNKGQTYGLGILERVLIVLLITLLVAGTGTIFGGVEIGGALASFILGLFTYQGFIELWLGLPSLTLLFIMMVWGSTK